MGIKVKIIEKSKPGHPEEKLYYVVPDNTGYTYFPVLANRSVNSPVFIKEPYHVCFLESSQGVNFNHPLTNYFSARKTNS
jgi:hypothetical protein